MAGGGPLGAIYEIGTLVALDEVLRGFDLIDCGVYVGVSSGSFIAAELANGLTPRAIYQMFIESEVADDPFEPEVLMRPALKDMRYQLALLPHLLKSSAQDYLNIPAVARLCRIVLAARARFATGIFDN